MSVFRAIASLMLLWASCLEAVAAIAVLDTSSRNQESEKSGDWSRSLYSATYMCDIAGYGYIVTDSLDMALDQDMMLISNCITKSSFSPEEWSRISDWVSGGGVLVAPALRSVDSGSSAIVDSLFGVVSAESGVRGSGRKLINWNPDFFSIPELEYIDEENERATSIGDVKSFGLAAGNADVLARFDTGEAAVVRNLYGSGRAYLVQMAWRDVVQRNQLNRDLNASRQYNNGFEPSSDVWPLFLRSIYACAHELSVWKFTVPAGYTQLLVPTHDCDSRTAYDAMHYMADYEKSLGLRGHYFLTTHYFSDKKNFGHSYLSDFYNDETIPLAAGLLEAGHTVGSHSICHFPDFNKTDNVDVVGRDEYAFRATCEDGVSRGASTWAEVVLSKQILEADLGNNVRSFRSGHLCVNKDIPAMLEEGEYAFQSCYTGGDLLSEFPFFGRIENKWEGELSDVLTMQLHISDVYNNKEGVPPLNDDSWDSHPAPDDWYAAMQKLRGNYASAVLLIHPNREWKMTLQQRLVDMLDTAEVGLYNFEDYGDFWLDRLNTDYSYSFDNDSRTLTVVADTALMLRSRLTFAVEVNGAVPEKVVIAGPDGEDVMEAELRQISGSRYLVIPVCYDYGKIEAVGMTEASPDGGQGIYDVSGRRVGSGDGLSSLPDSLPKGVYIVRDKDSSRKIMN